MAPAYAVSAVRYTAEGALVQRVRLHELLPAEIGPPLEVGRDQLVDVLETGRLVVAVRVHPTGRHSPLTTIRLVGLKGRSYLRSDGVVAASDDLSGLPHF
jgi:hypothetical protein